MSKETLVADPEPENTDVQGNKVSTGLLAIVGLGALLFMFY